MAELNVNIQNPPVIISQERYQDLLEYEVLVQAIAQARDDLDEFLFNVFVDSLFPKVPEDGNKG